MNQSSADFRFLQEAERTRWAKKRIEMKRWVLKNKCPEHSDANMHLFGKTFLFNNLS